MKVIVFGTVVALFTVICLLIMRSYRRTIGTNGRPRKLPIGFKLMRTLLTLAFLFGAGLVVMELVLEF